MINGVCPPSKKAGSSPYPLLDFCPLCPLVEVLPCPEPIPLPTLFFYE